MPLNKETKQNKTLESISQMYFKTVLFQSQVYPFIQSHT